MWAHPPEYLWDMARYLNLRAGSRKSQSCRSLPNAERIRPSTIAASTGDVWRSDRRGLAEMALRRDAFARPAEHSVQAGQTSPARAPVGVAGGRRRLGVGARPASDGLGARAAPGRGSRC